MPALCGHLSIVYHWQISYEEAPPPSAGDVTTPTPSNPQLDLRTRLVLDGSLLSGCPADPLKTIQAIIDADTKQRGFVQFAVTAEKQMFHVVQTAALDTQGKPQSVKPLLDLRVTILPQEARIEDCLDEWIQIVDRANHLIPDIPANMGLYSLQKRCIVGGRGTARHLLTEIVSKIDRQTTWKLWYVPELLVWGHPPAVLNFHYVLPPDDHFSYPFP